MSSNNVVGLFFLTKLVTVVLRNILSGFTNQTRSNQRAVHRTEQRTTEHTSNSKHVEGVHQDIMFCLEYQPLGRTGTYVSIGIGLYHQSILLDCRALKPVIKGTKPLR